MLKLFCSFPSTLKSLTMNTALQWGTVWEAHPAVINEIESIHRRHGRSSICTKIKKREVDVM